VRKGTTFLVKAKADTIVKEKDKDDEN